MKVFDYHCKNGHTHEKLFLLSELPPPEFAKCNQCEEQAEVQRFYVAKPVNMPMSNTTYTQGH
jgi:hypothetical protein